MSKNSNGNNPNTLPTPVTPQMPVPMPRSKAQDFRDGAAAINETAQTAYGIFSGMQDRQERQLNAFLDRQSVRFDKASELYDAAVSEGNLSLTDAADKYVHLEMLEKQEALKTLNAVKDGAVKDSTAGRNWLLGFGGLLLGGGVLAWGISKNN